MPIIVDDPTEQPEVVGETYASVPDVRAVYASDDSDEFIAAAIAYASALVDARAGRSFYPLTEQKVFGQTSGTIVLDVPGTVTEVEVNSSVISADAYEVDPSGVVRFRAEPGGIYYDTTRPLTVEPIRFEGHPFTVTVRGAFGQVSPLIKEATVLLAVARLGGQASGGAGVIPDLPANVTSFSVEGLSASFSNASSSTTTGKVSTGNATADRLIDLVALRPIGVA